MAKEARSAVIVYWFGEGDLKTDGGGTRALAWKHALADLGYEAVIVGAQSASSAVLDPHISQWLHRIKRGVFPLPFEKELACELDRYDLVVLSVPTVMRSALKGRLKPGTKVIIDWMDLPSQQAANWARVGSFVGRIGATLQSRSWRHREIEISGAGYDQVFAGFGDYQRRLPERAENVVWLPTPMASKIEVARGATENVRVKSLGMIANFHYPPNVQGILEFCREELSRLPGDITLTVAGFGSEDLNLPERVRVIGEIDDVEEFYSMIDAALVAVYTGGGVKVKAIEALLHGKPVIAADHVLEGFPEHIAEVIQPFDALKDLKVLPYPEVDLREFTLEHFTDGLLSLGLVPR